MLCGPSIVIVFLPILSFPFVLLILVWQRSYYQCKICFGWVAYDYYCCCCFVFFKRGKRGTILFFPSPFSPSSFRALPIHAICFGLRTYYDKGDVRCYAIFQFLFPFQNMYFPLQYVCKLLWCINSVGCFVAFCIYIKSQSDLTSCPRVFSYLMNIVFSLPPRMMLLGFGSQSIYYFLLFQRA